MERFVGVLAVFFWVAATLFVALLFTAGLSYDFVVGLLGSERLETSQERCLSLGLSEAAQHLPEGLGLDLDDPRERVVELTDGEEYGADQ